MIACALVALTPRRRSRRAHSAMLTRALMCVPIAAAAGRAQDAPLPVERMQDEGMELRVGWSRPLAVPARTSDGRNVIVGGVPAFDVEKRIGERSFVSLYYSGELLPLRPIKYSAARAFCIVACDAFLTHSTAVQAGLTLRAALGATYASVGVSERGTYSNPFAGCTFVICPDWSANRNTGFQRVGRMGLGLKPRGTGRRPTVEASLAVYRLGAGAYQRDFEVGGGVAW